MMRGAGGPARCYLKFYLCIRVGEPILVVRKIWIPRQRDDHPPSHGFTFTFPFFFAARFLTGLAER